MSSVPPGTPPPPSPAAHHPRGPRRRVDVVVVGAGVVGLATAWELHRQGMTIAVVDPEPGGGASRAAAGMLAPVSEAQFQQDRLFPLMLAAAEAYPSFVRTVEDATGRTVGYRPTDTLVCGVDAADRGTLADLQALQGRHGMPVEPLTLRAARTLEPALSPRLSAVFRMPSDHQVDPRLLVPALLDALQAAAGGRPAPADVHLQRAVALRHGSDGVVTGVVLDDGTVVEAGTTVLAAGMGATGIAGLPGTCRPRLRPVHGDILRCRLPEAVPLLLERTVRGLVHGVPVYLVPRADRSLVIGATAREDRLSGPSAGGVFRLLRDAQALVPGVADLELTEVMARARPGTPDDIPYLGRVRARDGAPVPGLVLSTGYSRHGVLLAPLAARLTARLVAEATGPAAADAVEAAHLVTTDPHRFDPAGTDRTDRTDHVDRAEQVDRADVVGTATLARRRS